MTSGGGSGGGRGVGTCEGTSVVLLAVERFQGLRRA